MRTSAVRRTGRVLGFLTLGGVFGTFVGLRGGGAQSAGWTIVLLHTIWCAVEGRLQPVRRWGTEGADLRLPLVAGSLTGLVVLAAIVDLRSERPILLVVGFLVGLLGVCLRAASILSLGEAFLDGVDWGPGQRRVRGGVYRLRHPAELGTLMILAGTCLASGSPVAITLLTCGVLPTSVLRVLREERRSFRGPRPTT